MLDTLKQKDRTIRIIPCSLRRFAAQRTLGLALCIALFCGCSTPKYTEYHGADVFQGKGGSVRTVDDIDIWGSGEPDRKYKILGLVEESPRHRLPFGRLTRAFSSPSDDRYAAIAKIAQQKGGDAVFIVTDVQASSADDDDGGGRTHRRIRKFVIVKYVE